MKIWAIQIKGPLTQLCEMVSEQSESELLFEERAHICSPCDNWPGAKGLGLSEGAYMLVILSISVVIVFASLLVLS